MAKQYQVRSLGICTSGSKLPTLPDLSIPVSHCPNWHIRTNTHTPSTIPTPQFGWPTSTEPARSVLRLGVKKCLSLSDLNIPASHRRYTHIQTNLYTSSARHTMHFRWTNGTERVCSVSASQGQNHPPRRPTSATHIFKPTCIFCLRAPPYPFDGKAVLSHALSICVSESKNAHSCPISASRPPTTATHIVKPICILPPRARRSFSMDKQYRVRSLGICISGHIDGIRRHSVREGITGGVYYSYFTLVYRLIGCR